MKAQAFNNKKVMVFGWARSGKAAAQHLVTLGAQVTVVNGGDFVPDDTFNQLQAAGVTFINHDEATPLEIGRAHV